MNFLEVTISETLSYKNTHRKIGKEISKVIGTMWRIKNVNINILYKYTMLQFYHLNYGILHWEFNDKNCLDCRKRSSELYAFNNEYNCHTDLFQTN